MGRNDFGQLGGEQQAMPDLNIQPNSGAEYGDE